MKEVLFLLPLLHMPNSDFDKFQPIGHIEQTAYGQYSSLYQKDNKIIITSIKHKCAWSNLQPYYFRVL